MPFVTRRSILAAVVCGALLPGCADDVAVERTRTDPEQGGCDCKSGACSGGTCLGTTVELLKDAPTTSDTFTDAPFETFYQTKRHQFIYLAGDLSAAGVPAGATITALWLMTATPLPHALDGFRLAVRSTLAATLATGAFDGDTLVVFGPTDMPAAGFAPGTYTRFDLPIAFVWDGASNLLVDLSFQLPLDGTLGGGVVMRENGRAGELAGGYAHMASGAYPYTLTASYTASAIPALQLTFD